MHFFTLREPDLKENVERSPLGRQLRTPMKRPGESINADDERVSGAAVGRSRVGTNGDEIRTPPDAPSRAVEATTPLDSSYKRAGRASMLHPIE